MKRVLAAVLFASFASAALAVEWFDESCICCKPMHDNPALMSRMKWETHKITNGLMMVAAPPEGMIDEFEATCHAMHTAAENAKPSDPMCGFCLSFTELAKAGAKVEEVKTGVGQMTLITSDDPAVVKKIHAHSDRTQEEMDKMAVAAH